MVDDDLQMINKIKNTICDREDIEIIGTAHNGEEEINLINSLKPNVVITDNKMPFLDGIEVIEKYKDSDNKPFFIMISSDTEMLIKSIKCGFKYLDKLSNFARLHDFIDEYKNEHIEEKIQKVYNMYHKKQSFFSKFFKYNN